MKRYIFGVIPLCALLISACATHQTTAAPVKSSTTSAIAKAPSLSNLKVGQQGTYITISALVSNTTNKAIPIQPSDFALISNTTTLSPDSQSKVPEQVPANYQSSITLMFNVKGQLSGTVSPKLGFQPSGNLPEQFKTLGTIKIPVPKPVSNPVSKPSTNSPSTASTATTTSSSVTHDYQADITQDVALIKSKATITVSGVQWTPIVNANPDAEVPDGFGGMLYAWNVIVDGNGDGTAQQIYFFDDNRYLGTDTSSYHAPSRVSPGGSGSIIATYDHYLQGDPNSSPSGRPYVVTFHWNGSQLLPDAPQTLKDALTNQFD